MPDHSFCEESFPNIQPKHLLEQLMTITSCLIVYTKEMGKQTSFMHEKKEEYRAESAHGKS